MQMKMKAFEIAIETFLTVLIMFTLLGILFIFVISKIESNAYNSEIQSQLEEKIKALLTTLDSDATGSFKKTLRTLLPEIKMLGKTSSQNISDEHNTWLFRTIWLVIAFLLAGFVLFVTMLHFIPNHGVHIARVIGWTLFSFIAVGLVEILFFLNIATKFIPAPPSLLVNAIFDQLKKW